MNIKIPYEKLGDIKSYKFISLILDKNKNTIYRKDFTNESQIFSREFVTVPDDLYGECDSIIFFPFSNKTNNWANQVIMWKNEGEFLKFNGGYEFLRNSDKTGDLNKLNEWLIRGKEYDKKSEPIGEKNLIYFTLFGSNEYIRLLKILLTSLKKQSYQNFELLFITDETTKSKLEVVSEIEPFVHHYHIVDEIKDPVDASMEKLKIYNWPKINDYKKILFLDVDIVVIGNLNAIFDVELDVNVFYGATHNRDQRLHKTIYHCLIDYTEEQLNNFSDKGITALNAGQYFFVNTPTMNRHFENINKFVSEWDGPYFFEQSFINYYFNLLEVSNTQRFEEQFQFVSINERHTDNKFGPNAVFVHFMGNACNGLGKLEFMKKYYSQYIYETGTR